MNSNKSTNSTVLEQSIAVLPFANLNTDGGNTHFSIGVQDTDLNTRKAVNP
jgi:TolB-like protein